MVWSLVPKENTQAMYGISNLKLEGASLNPNHTGLDDGVNERDITMYLQAVVKKKEKEKEKENRKLVSIPVYL